MLLNPYRFGGGGGGLFPLPEQVVTFVAGSYLNQTDTVSSRSVIIPGTTVIGDLMVATILHVGAITAPSGWTQYFNEAAGAGSIRLSVWRKTAASGDAGASRVWTQSVTSALQVHYTVVRGSNPLSILGHATSIGTTGDTSILMPECSPTNRGQFIIAACARSSGPADIPATASLSAGWSTRSVSTSSGAPIRKLLGTRVAVNLTDTQGYFSYSPGAASPGWRAVQLLIGYT